MKPTMKNLLKWLRPKEDEDGLRALLKQADETIEREKAKSSELIEKYQSAMIEIAGLKEKAKAREERIAKLESELQQLKKQLREQTEADLYLESAKIIKRIESGEKVTAEDEAYKRLLSYRRYYGQMLSQEAARSRQSRGLNALTQYQNALTR